VISVLVSSAGRLSVAHLCFALSQWSLVVYLARTSGLGEAGYFSLAMAIAAPIYLFSFQGVKTVRGSQGNSPRYGQTIILSRLINLALATVLAVLVLVFGLAGSPDSVSIGGSIVCLKLAEGVCDLSYGERQRIRDFPGISLSLIARSAIVFMGLVLGISLYVEPITLILSISIASLVWSVGWHSRDITSMARERGREPGLRLTRRKVWAAMLFSWRHLPLGGSTGLASLGPNLPRYLLAYFSGAEAVAVYSLLLYFPLMAQLLIVSLGQTQIASLGDQYRGNRSLFLSRLNSLTATAAALGLLLLSAGAVAGETVLTILYGPKLAGYGFELTFFLAYSVPALAVSALHYGLVAAGIYRLQFWIHLSGVMSLVILAAILIPLLGLQGSAIALFIAATGQAMAGYWVLRRDLNG
jgi:O-antigen/teichoic acid export membrane protein